MIVVFGSLNADLVFSLATLPAVGETVLTDSYRVFAGGKGANQAVAAACSGSPTRMVGCVGHDSLGDQILTALEETGVTIDSVKRMDAVTGCAAIGVDPSGHNQIMVAGGANMTVRSDHVEAEWLTPESTLVLQMEVPAEENWQLVERARKAGVRVILNAAPAGPVPEASLAQLDALIVNEHEALHIARALGHALDEPIGAVRTLSRALGILCIVTMGREGCFACSTDGEWSVASLPITPVDTTGAGDAFCGVFASSLDQGLALPDALRRASVGGSLACLKAGAQSSMPSLSDINAHLAELDFPRET